MVRVSNKRAHSLRDIGRKLKRWYNNLEMIVHLRWGKKTKKQERFSPQLPRVNVNAAWQQHQGHLFSWGSLNPRGFHLGREQCCYHWAQRTQGQEPISVTKRATAFQCQGNMEEKTEDGDQKRLYSFPLEITAWIRGSSDCYLLPWDPWNLFSKSKVLIAFIRVLARAEPELGECDFLIPLGLSNASVLEGRPLDSLYIILIPEMLVCLKPAQDIIGPLVH